MKRLLYWIGLLCLITACCAVSASSLNSTPEATEPPVPLLVTVTPADTPTPPPTLTPTRVPFPSSTPRPTTTLTFTPRPTSTPTRVYWGRTAAVPILMYHHIAIPPERADAIRLDLSVWPERFDQQLAYFASHDYHALKLADVYDAVMKGAPLPSNPIVFTFDDAYDDAYYNALPILKKYNFVGTFYVPTGLLGRTGYMTWEQVIELSKAGMDIESHSVTHASMKGKTSSFLLREMGDSKRVLEANLGHPVEFFCYPGGAYDALAIQVLQELGYLSATTTQPGAHEHESAPFEWPRVRVRGADQVGDLIARIHLLLYGR